MKIGRDMRLEADEFYNYMLDSVLDQIRGTLGKELKREDLKKGYSHKNQYVDKNGKRKTSRYTITRAEPNKAFQTTFNDASQRTVATYTITETETGIHVDYTQETQFHDSRMKPKGTMGKIDQYLLKRKLTRSLAHVEKEIKKKQR